MNNLFILTSRFPYEGGEQFLETEIIYWEKSNFDNIFILPAISGGQLRSIPKNIRVINKPVDHSKAKYLIRALFSPILYKEIFHLSDSRKLTLSTIKIAFKETAKLLREKNCLENVLKEIKVSNSTIYSYWNNTSFYAACLLKTEGKVSKTISRAHRGDLYEEESLFNYMPFKRQLSNASDQTYLLAKNAMEYYQSTYSVSSKLLDVSRLGVTIPKNLVRNVNSNILKFISISYCVPVKQIDLILKSVTLYAQQYPDQEIEWTHIGDGPLYDALKIRALEAMERNSNICINFTGALSNVDVKKNLDTNDYDIMINASKSEGIPVSIMEAMSYGIPAIAPDIGGISDLVNLNNGYLMPTQCKVDDIITGIKYIINHKVDLGFNAYQWANKNFNADLNYPDFISKLEQIAEIDEQ